jgi:hypothetical protein
MENVSEIFSCKLTKQFGSLERAEEFQNPVRQLQKKKHWNVLGN